MYCVYEVFVNDVTLISRRFDIPLYIFPLLLQIPEKCVTSLRNAPSWMSVITLLWLDSCHIVSFLYCRHNFLSFSTSSTSLFLSSIDVLFWSSQGSKSSETLTRLYEMDENPDRRMFLDRLLSFMEDRGTPITQCPTISKNPLDIYKLYIFTKDRGGYLEVSSINIFAQCRNDDVVNQIVMIVVKVHAQVEQKSTITVLLLSMIIKILVIRIN